MQRCLLAMLILGGLTGLMASQPKIKEWRVDGILVRDSGTVRSLGLTVDDMENLTYGVDEIPDHECRPNPYNGNHTIIGLNGNGDKPTGWLRSHITRGWTNISTGELLSVTVRVYDKSADEYETYENYRWGTQVLPVKGSFSGLPLGEECFRHGKNRIWFRLGRCAVEVELLVRREAEWSDGLYVEALAWGIEYRIQQHPKRLVTAQKQITVLVSNQPVMQGEAVSLAGVTVAPISALSPAQVSFKTNRTSKEWTVIASRNGQWAKLKAFSWDMETEKGKVKLERPVFPYKGELIVPLRQVAESLGISVQQKGQTIALTPK
ncbi:MAG: copper amine oxidase N-terminal domain-containing protein [Armatimonadetes bacterium]|nr:copper amine oxidase N-terminal domain-containing protein [Armatimonadota bacterium]MDW8028852.1 stalk domain-containing protein [Armatimonadota bacterium]